MIDHLLITFLGLHTSHIKDHTLIPRFSFSRLPVSTP